MAASYLFFRPDECLFTENGNLENTDILEVCIVLLTGECDEASASASLTTLMKIFQNVVSHPGEEKYKVIRKENKAFASKVWCYSGAQQFLLATGWSEVDDTIVLTGDINSLNTAIKVLQAHLSQNGQNASPQKQVPNHVDVQSSSVHKDLKKAKMLDEGRRKQQETYKRQMEEKKRIREQIEADRRETKTRESKSSKAQTVTSGRGLTKFSDIGVDVNKGGG